MSKTAKIPRKILFVYPDRMTEGGMPEDTRQFIAAVSRIHDGTVSLLSRGVPYDRDGILGDTATTDIDGGGGGFQSLIATLSPDDITVFITFSNLTNIRVARQLRQRGLRYSVLPAWQVHEFLDWDRPFPRTTVPTVDASEKDSERFNTLGRGGVVEGRRTPRGAARSLKRKLYRKTLGKSFLDHASGIHVFSDLEQAKIERLVKPADPNFLDITFGTSVETRQIGSDEFPNDDRINIIFWGRVDYYYKGLDTILDAIALAKEEGVSAPFRFWIAGPDYNDGYRKLRKHIERSGIGEFVRILAPGGYTPGTIGLLKSANFCIMASRWDGHARAIRESVALGVPFISNRETHFDRIVKYFGNGLIFDNEIELSKILSQLDSAKVKAISQSARENRETRAKYMGWPSCAQRFIENLTRLK